MLSQAKAHTQPIENSKSYDQLMSELLALVCHQRLSNCSVSLVELVNILEQLINHEDCEHYPAKQRVLIKMRHLWQTRLFGLCHQRTFAH